jgi:biopolymer transport protein TolR
MQRKGARHLDFEINLIPFIDLLSVCICFLLLTAVWVNIGSMNVKQAVGGQAIDSQEKKPTLWIFLNSKQELTLNLKDSAAPKNLLQMTIQPQEGVLNLMGLGAALKQIIAAEPRLRSALIHPQAQTQYDEIIDLMDQVKREGLTDLGIAPL